MIQAFPRTEELNNRLFLPAPPSGWWLPIFGTLQAYMWRTVGAM